MIMLTEELGDTLVVLFEEHEFGVEQSRSGSSPP